jgi:DNA repair protein RadC
MLLPSIRLKHESGNLYKSKITTSAQAFDYASKLLDIEVIGLIEEFAVLYLNRGNKTIGWFSASKGSMVGTTIDIRLIVKVALDIGALGMILIHNHPSGNKFPSNNDLEITNKIKIAAGYFDINVIDHLIISGELDEDTSLPKEYYSFADSGSL